MADFTFASFSNELGRFADSLSTKVVKEITREMGEQAQALAARSAAGDLGPDRQHTGSGKGWQVPLDTKLIAKPDGATILSPTRFSAGPWTVAERGRNVGETGLLLGPGISQKQGTTLRNKNGNVRKVRSFKSERWNGVTAGKDTASDAVSLMKRSLPAVAERGVNRAIVARFGKG